MVSADAHARVLSKQAPITHCTAESFDTNQEAKIPFQQAGFFIKTLKCQIGIWASLSEGDKDSLDRLAGIGEVHHARAGWCAPPDAP